MSVYKPEVHCCYSRMFPHDFEVDHSFECLDEDSTCKYFVDHPTDSMCKFRTDIGRCQCRDARKVAKERYYLDRLNNDTTTLRKTEDDE